MQSEETTRKLVTLIEFRRSGDCPIEPYHLLMDEGEKMQKFGAAVRYGRKWLIDPDRFYEYLRQRCQEPKNGASSARPTGAVLKDPEGKGLSDSEPAADGSEYLAELERRIKAEGCTRLPHSWMEALFRARLPAIAITVVLAIARHSYGESRKKEWWVTSDGQIADALNANRRTVERVVRQLSSDRYIELDGRSQGAQQYKVRIQLDQDRWKRVAS